MRERIKQLLEYFRVNQTEFAKRINVSKASVSHIMSLNGRGGEFKEENIDKIVQAFPGVNKEWLLTGTGPMIDPEKATHTQQQIDFSDALERRNYPHEEKSPIIDGVNDSEAVDTSVTDKRTEPSVVNHSKAEKVVRNNRGNNNTEKKQVSRIVIFYNDGSFCEYSPDYSNF